ncbi:hypothetical protein NQD34_013481 [Periophthalmus magnuspinnatus]|nr:hypothetical protein NQD34_013481 [Periophthalmus magnuspinnatus]
MYAFYILQFKKNNVIKVFFCCKLIYIALLARHGGGCQTHFHQGPHQQKRASVKKCSYFLNLLINCFCIYYLFKLQILHMCLQRCKNMCNCVSPDKTF